jgi:hypothetical protein
MKKREINLNELRLLLKTKTERNPYLGLGYLLGLIDYNVITLDEYKKLRKPYLDIWVNLDLIVKNN